MCNLFTQRLLTNLQYFMLRKLKSHPFLLLSIPANTKEQETGKASVTKTLYKKFKAQEQSF